MKVSYTKSNNDPIVELQMINIAVVIVIVW